VELTAGIVIADRFRLVRPLGQGGMGAVWLAQHIGLDVPCAVKVIHAEAAQSPELRARFEREAKAAAQIRSPHVVQILDHGVWEGAPYIAMELLEGEDLGQRLHRRGVLPPHETVALAVQVGRALAKAHGAGLVHRDLKPANIFLVRDEDREIAKVLDFGVAKVKETGLDGTTKTGAVLGTPYYMSPEQARGSKDLDHRSDLWALAVVVYRCVTGRLPFRGEALGDLFVKIIVEPLPVPSLVSNAPPGFDAWWERAAARDPGQRFQTAKELSDALGLALGVTVGAGVEVGSSLASSVTLPPLGAPPATLPAVPDSARPPIPSQSDSVPTTTQPMTPPPASSATRPLGEATMPLTPPGAMAPPSPTPWPNSAPTPLQQAISVREAPPSRRGTAVTIAITAAVILGGVGLFFALRPAAPRAEADAPAPAPAAAAPAAAEPQAAAAPTASVSPPPSATTTAPAAIPAPRPTAATHTGAPPAPPATPAKGAAVSRPPPAPAAAKPKTDFGF
jgi:serine/threonine-protein kinase